MLFDRTIKNFWIKKHLNVPLSVFKKKIGILSSALFVL